MKINYKNTALNLLDKWDEEINLPDPHKPMTEAEKKDFGRSLLTHLENTGPLFRNKIQYISQPFMEAYQKGKHKLVDVFDKEEIEDSGTFIWQVGSFTHTNFYYLKTFIKDGVWGADYIFLQFSKAAKNDFKSIDVFVIKTRDRLKSFIWKGHYETGHTQDWYFAFLVSFICFIKHVQLETKEIKANSKSNHVGIKYVNETKSNIEVLDSTWFTTIVRSEGFGVRGHFRMQPFSGGEKKLIWISDYQKQGYTRKAKLLTNDRL